MRIVTPVLLLVLTACGSFGEGSTAGADAGAADGGATAIRLRGVSSSGPGTSLTVQSPPGVQEGDFLLATVQADGNGIACTASEGWKLLESGGTLGCATTYGLSARLYRFAGASEPSEQTPCQTSAQSGATVIVAYVGVDPKTPVQASGSTALAVQSATELTAPSVSVLDGPTLLVTSFVDPNASAASWKGPDGMVQRAANTQIALFDAMVAAGDTGPRTATKPTSNFCGSATGFAIALQPKP